MKVSAERSFVAFIVSGSLGVTGAHLIAAVLRHALSQSASPGAADMTWAMLLTALGFALSQPLPERVRRWLGLTLSVAASAIVAARQGTISAAVLGIVIGGFAQTEGAIRLERVLPDSLSGILRRRPFVSVLWGAAAVVFLIQTGRLATYMTDDASDWWLTTRLEFWSKHMCLPGYIEPADLHRQGVGNVYDARYYVMLNREAKPHLTVRNMDFYAGDPFQYPPQFLLAPVAALALTDDFFVIRAAWYGIQVLAFVLTAFLLGRWLRPEAGWGPVLLIPLIVISVPVMQSLQYGQFHLMALVLAVGGMLCFVHDRHAAGGLLLAAATVGKIFPGVLLLPLLFRRQWKSVGWTVAWAAAISLLALLVLGAAPFEAFLNYHLPRAANGEAFAFGKAWPEYREVLLGDNLSVGALPAKLGALGLEGMSEAMGKPVLAVYSVLLAGLGVIAARRWRGRVGEAAVWLALLNLAALQSPAAWGDYVTLGSVWLLTLLSVPLSGGWPARLVLTVCWVFAFALPGLQPMPDIPSVPTMMIATILGVLLLVGLNAWVIVSRRHPEPA